MTAHMFIVGNGAARLIHDAAKMAADQRKRGQIAVRDSCSWQPLLLPLISGGQRKVCGICVPES